MSGRRIIQGAKEALAFARGDESRGTLHGPDEILEGYRDGLNDDRDALPESLANRSEQYRHGWQNGRDDRLGKSRASAATIRAALAKMGE